MKLRLSVFLGLMLLALGVLDHYLQLREAEARRTHSIFRPLVDPRLEIVPERVRRLHLTLPGTQPLAYERRGNTWRFPAYFDAYVPPGRIERLLESVLTTYGTLVTDDASQMADYGLDPSRAVRIAAEDASGQALVEVWVGGAIAAGSGESYARRADSESILHLHASPAREIGGGRPPMIDPRLLPQALPRGTVSEIRVMHEDGPYALRRVAAPVDVDSPLPFSPHERARFRWIVDGTAGVDTCFNLSVYSYLDFVSRVMIVQLVDPAGDYGFVEGPQVELIDEEGGVTTIEVGARHELGTYAHNVGARLVSIVDEQAATWLTPPAQSFLDTLPSPSIYEQLLHQR
ncbi:MAG: DUF4340 domain-containing protein [Candidatus Latescibacterota bacterium]|nr:DUF4340 domain-containing protein [Candidatus Latescibacterota bacterium]